MNKNLLALLPAFVLATGCTFSGLPGDLVLGEASQEELQQLCEATQRFQEENLSEEDRRTFGCNLAGSIAGAISAGFGGDFEESCEEARESCVEDWEPGENEIDCDDPSMPSDCEATVAEYEACQRERVENVKKANAEFTCAEPEDDEDDDDEAESACDIFYDKCGISR